MATGCSSSGVATEAPEPAGPTPSPLAVQVCSAEAQRDINLALGVTAHVTTPSWIHRRYSCAYTYPSGSFTLSITELSSWAQTYAYYDGLARTLGRSRTLAGLGQAAFQAPNGDVVVRKDWKVLLTDVHGLPPEFAVPPDPPGAIAVTVADEILSCWAGD